MTLKKKLTLPNILSAYRIFTFPVILLFAVNMQEKLFVVFFVDCLKTTIFVSCYSIVWI